MTARPDGMQNRGRIRPIAWFAIAALAVAGLAAVYGMGGLRGNASSDPGCRSALQTVRRMSPLVRGEVAAVAVATDPRALPDLSFRQADGHPKQLADWAGRVVLLNLWATWCVPCRKEMPSLDRLEAQLGGQAFEVVAVNIDTRDPDKPRTWLGEIGVNHLVYYADPTAKLFQDLKLKGLAFGMPTTLIIDPHGCELAALAGPADWSSKDALALLRAAIGT
jgi:thiol-disulfide isomerase/thioredoxin